MPLTLEISPELEPFLEAEAAKSGQDVVTFAEAVLRKSLCPAEKTIAPSLSGEEARLLAEINLGPSTSEMESYIALIRKRQNETITDDELKELLTFNTRMEKLAVRRVQSLAKLAELRDVEIDELMSDLQIEPPDVL